MVNDAWVTALDSARARWKTASGPERAAITAELDSLWDTLSLDQRAAVRDELARAASDPDMDDAPVRCAPRWSSVRALLTWNRVWQAEAFGAH